MKQIKTYGINGLLEWHGVVHSEGINMRVDFTNGSVTAYGVAPATFSTKHELTQHVIENSDEFKSGRIRLISKHYIAEAPAQEAKASAVGGAEPDADASGTVAGGDSSTVAGGDSGTVAGAPMKISVGSRADAVVWLKEHYPDKGYTSLKLRSKESFDAACAECHVVFEF